MIFPSIENEFHEKQLISCFRCWIASGEISIRLGIVIVVVVNIFGLFLGDCGLRERSFELFVDNLFLDGEFLFGDVFLL